MRISFREGFADDIESNHDGEQHSFSAYIVLISHNNQVMIQTLELLQKIWMHLKLTTVILQPVIRHPIL